MKVNRRKNPSSGVHNVSYLQLTSVKNEMNEMRSYVYADWEVSDE